MSFVPFAPGLLQGGVFYFRDLSTYFFPLRRFVVEGLSAGEIRRWNPYSYEGVPVLAISYPVDLLQVLLPNEWGLSLLLALHVPLAALTFLSLARRLGRHPAAATLGAVAYALCGFSLSSINLYLLAQAFAWAPLVVAMLLRCREGGSREIAAAGAAVALCVSTMGLEIAAQAIACGLLLAASGRLAAWLRPAAAVLLGLGLAALPLQQVAHVLSGSRRGEGFPVVEALNQSVHPVSLLQALIAGLYGDPAMATSHSYWGARFWGATTPYVLSLYLGGVALCLAAIGAARAERGRRRLLLLLVGALVVSLGRWARLDLVLEALPSLAAFRFPVKAFFTVVLASSLLAAAGADALVGSRRAWRAFGVAAAVLGGALLSLTPLRLWLPAGSTWLSARFFPDSAAEALQAAALQAVANDAAAGAAALLAAAALAALVFRGRIRRPAAVAALAAVVALDLARAGAGLNPTAHRSFYQLSPEMTRVAARLRDAGGHAFTCTVQAMPTFREAARAGRAGIWTAAVGRETLSPQANLDAGVAATGFDATGAVPASRAFTETEAMCREAGTLERLRQSGVRHVLSVQPFSNEALRLVEVARPQRTLPLSIYVYELAGGLPDPSVWLTPDDVDARGAPQALDGARARYLDSGWGRVRVAVESPREAWLILRRASAPGWSATVNLAPVPIAAANGRHQAVPVPEGVSDVVLRYRAPSGALGGATSLACAALAVALCLRRRGARSDAPPRETPASATG